MHLRAASIDQLASRVVHLLDKVDHAVELGIGRVQVVVVDVESKGVGKKSRKVGKAHLAAPSVLRAAWKATFTKP